MSALGDIFKRREPGSRALQKPVKNRSDVVVMRAKDLIEELVSPLSEPNQKVIDEVLTIIAQTSSLPDSMLNKEAVQKTLKELLFELVDPIPNPNKQLIDELLQLVVRSDKFMIPQPSVQQAAAQQLRSQEYDIAGVSDEKMRITKGNMAVRQKHMDAVAQAPYPTDDQQTRQKDKETKSIMNLLLEQIKELISITNNLNTKIKTQQVRIESLDTNMTTLKKKSQEFNDRMVAFEKNMEKFIGLYEVVTNQYNPFVDNNMSSGELYGQGQQEDRDSPLVENVLNPNKLQVKPMQQVKPQKPTLMIGSTDIVDIHSLSDALIAMPDEKFSEQVLAKKEEIIKFVRDVLAKPVLADELLVANSKNEMIKCSVKHSYL